MSASPRASLEQRVAVNEAEDRRAARQRDRSRRRLLVASVVGPLLGAVMGIALGSVAFEVVGAGFVMVLAGCIIFATAVAFLIASSTSLETVRRP